MTIHFIGAGPGAPDLITVRGLNYIKALYLVGDKTMAKDFLDDVEINDKSESWAYKQELSRLIGD